MIRRESAAAFSGVITEPAAAGISTSQSASSTASPDTSLAAGETADVAGGLDVLGQPRDVQPVGMEDAAGEVGDGHHGGALGGDGPRRDAADVSKSLHGHPQTRPGGDSSARRPRWMVATTPLPVASRRPTMPPSTTGLPVTKQPLVIAVPAE